MKRTNLKIVLLISYWLIAMTAFSQAPKQADQQWLYDLVKEEMPEDLYQLIKETALLEDLDISKSIFPTSLIANKTIEPKSGILPTTLMFQSVYNSFYEDSLGIPNFYNSLQIGTGIQLNQLPIKINGRLVWADKSIQSRLSSLSIDFDPHTFLRQHIPDVKAITKEFNGRNPLSNTKFTQLKNKGIGQLPVLSDLTDQDLGVVKKELLFQVYQHVVHHPTFIEWMEKKDALQTQIISSKQTTKDKAVAKIQMTQQNLRDSIGIITTKAAEVAANLQQQLETIQQKTDSLLLRYEQAWEGRKSYYGDSLMVLKEKIATYTDIVETYQQPDKIRSKLLTDKTQPLTNRLLAATTQFSIGQSILNDSWYTAKNLPLNGLQYHFKNKRLYGGVAYGKQVFNTRFSPIWSSNLFNSVNRGNILFVQAGYQLGKEDAIDYTYINVKNEGNGTGFVIAPESNTVFSLKAKKQLKEGVRLNTVFSFSRNTWGRIDLSGSNQIGSKNTAAEITFLGNLWNNHLTVELGYFYVGPEFIAAANPFLQNNQKGLVSKLKGQVGNSLRLGGEMKIGTSIDESYFNGQQNQVQLIGDFSWQATKSISVSGQITPNFFKHQGVGDFVLTNNNMLYQVQVLSRLPIKQSTLLVNLGLTNYNNQLHQFDTLLVNESNYFFTQQSLLLPNQASLSLLSMIGWVSDATNNELNNTSIFYQLNYAINKPKWSLQVGGQLLKDIDTTDWYYGITQFCNIPIGQKMALKIDASLQLPVKKDLEHTARYWTNLSLTKQF